MPVQRVAAFVARDQVEVCVHNDLPRAGADVRCDVQSDRVEFGNQLTAQMSDNAAKLVEILGFERE